MHPRMAVSGVIMLRQLQSLPVEVSQVRGSGNTGFSHAELASGEAADREPEFCNDGLLYPGL